MRSVRAAMLGLPVVALLLVSAPAWAITPQDVVRLSKAGVSDEVILALIESDRTIFSLTADQLLALKRDGVSESVVIAMLQSGRQEPSAPSQTAPAAGVEAGPIVGFVGHGPDRPNVASLPDADMVAAPYPVPSPYPIPYGVPSFVPYPVAVRTPRVHRAFRDQPVLPPVPVTAPSAFAAPLPVANTLGPVSARGMFFTNSSSATGMFFTARPAVPESPRGPVSR